LVEFLYGIRQVERIDTNDKSQIISERVESVLSQNSAEHITRPVRSNWPRFDPATILSGTPAIGRSARQDPRILGLFLALSDDGPSKPGESRRAHHPSEPFEIRVGNRFAWAVAWACTGSVSRSAAQATTRRRWLRGFRLLVGRGRKPTPVRYWRDRSAIRLVGTDSHAIRLRIEAQVQLAGGAAIDLSGIWPLVGMIVNDGPATLRTPPRHARTLARCPSARCSELHRVTSRKFGSHPSDKTP
jgi:hypothetical protein